MRLTPLKIFAAAVVLSGLGAFAGASHAAGDATLEEVAAYRSWERLTLIPFKVETPSYGGG
ncbi:MAG TPA: hypothetical protein VF521_19485 [Pyrinomonadaceae bacterium]